MRLLYNFGHKKILQRPYGVVAMGLSIYFLFGRGAHDALVEQTLHREQVVARAGASSMSAIFNITGASLAKTAQDPDIENFGPDLQGVLDRFIASWEDGFVEAIAATDEKGVIRYFANKKNISTVELDVSDRDYFIKARSLLRGSYEVFGPVVSKGGITKGQSIVPIASPIKNSKGNFKGVLVTPVLVSKLTNFFLDPLKISERTRVYLIDEKGIIITSPFENLQGKNYLDFIAGSGFLGSQKTAQILKASLDSKKEGKLDIFLPNEQTGKLERFLIAYSPLAVGENHWTLVVASPIKEVLAFMVPFYKKGVIMVGVLTLVAMILVIRVSKAVAYIEATKFEHEVHKLA